MHSAIVIAEKRCKRLATLAPQSLSDFNPFAGMNMVKGIPGEVYKDNAADLMAMVNYGYHSLKDRRSTALMAVEGNLFPVQGICEGRLKNISYGLFWYETTGEGHE